MTDENTAVREAKQEAGVCGRIAGKPASNYWKDERKRTIDVRVYMLQVEKQARRWREQQERKRKWASPLKAARRVNDPGLRKLLEQFASAA
jgi:hypothetical protein